MGLSKSSEELSWRPLSLGTSVFLKLQQQSSTSQAHGNQHPEHRCNPENLRSHWTVLSQPLFKDLRAMVQRIVVIKPSMAHRCAADPSSRRSSKRGALLSQATEQGLQVAAAHQARADWPARRWTSSRPAIRNRSADVPAGAAQQTTGSRDVHPQSEADQPANQASAEGRSRAALSPPIVPGHRCKDIPPSPRASTGIAQLDHHSAGNVPAGPAAIPHQRRRADATAPPAGRCVLH